MLFDSIQDINKILFSIPFNNLLGMQVTKFTEHTITTEFAMQPNLIGNPIQKILHGGVIATILDMTGGLLVMAKVYAKNPTLSKAELLTKIGKVSTIDLHINYLQPGRGTIFTSTASLLHGGYKISTTNIIMTNQDETKIAVATGTYTSS